MTPSHGGAGPVEPAERVLSLDVLRGFALFGILIVNIGDYAPDPASSADHLVVRLVEVLAEDSFYPLFSLLFGIGFAIFLDRARIRGGNGIWLYFRRLASLLLIALFQIVFLEDRNILVRYAILALPLLLFWRASARTCAWAGVVVLVLTVARPAVAGFLNQRAMSDPARAAVLQREQTAERQMAMAMGAEAARVDSTGSYRQAVVFRARYQVPAQIGWAVSFLRNRSLFRILAMFLLGAAAWRAGLFTHRLPTRRTLAGLAVAGIAGGVIGNLVMTSGPEGDPLPLFATYPVSTMTQLLGDILLTMGYVAAALRILGSLGPAPRRGVRAMASVGRMGLTNYLWQSVVMALLFLPYGLGLSHQLPLWATVLLAVPIWLSHIPLSTWWLARHRLGPMEWIWRTFTYGARP